LTRETPACRLGEAGDSYPISRRYGIRRREPLPALTASRPAIKAARTEPVNALRHE